MPARLLDLLVAVDHALPIEVVTRVVGDLVAELPAELADLEAAGLIEWLDDETIAATPTARAATVLSRPQRADLRGRVAHAATDSNVPAGLVTSWAIEALRTSPDPAAVHRLVRRADRLMRAGDLENASDVLTVLVESARRGLVMEPTDRIHVHLRLGYTLRWLGRHDEAEVLAEQAHALAHSTEDPVAIATAALSWRPESISTDDDPSNVALIDTALAAIADSDERLRSRLLAARSDALVFLDLDAAQHSADQALELARSLTDTETFIRAAYAWRVSHWHPSRQATMLDLAGEMIARSPGALDFAEFGALTRIQVFLELGDWSHVDGELASMGRRLTGAARPLELLWYNTAKAARAQSKGEFDLAEQLTNSALATTIGPDYGAAFQLLLTQQLLNAWHRGDDLTPLADPAVLPAGPMRSAWEASLLGWTCTRRSPAEVIDTLDRLLAKGRDGIRPDLTFGPTVASLAIATVQAQAHHHASIVAEVIEPYVDQWAGTGGAVVMGPFSLHLGNLWALMGRVEPAMTCLNVALADAQRGGCVPWMAHARLGLAAATTSTGEREQHLREAVRLAESVGMRALAVRASELLGRSVLPSGLTEREAEVLRLVAEGATNAQIAQRLFLSVKTVERHLINAYRKAGVRNRAEASAFTQRNLQ